MNKVISAIYALMIIGASSTLGNNMDSSGNDQTIQFLDRRSGLEDNPVLKHYTDLRLSIISKEGLDELISVGKVLVDLRGIFNEGDAYLVVGEPGMGLLETLNFYMREKGIKPRNFLTVKLFTKNLIYQNYYFKLDEEDDETLKDLKLLPGDVIFTHLYGDF